MHPFAHATPRPLRQRRWCLTSCCLVVVASVGDAHGRVYRCSTTTGAVLFTQFCPPDRQLALHEPESSSFVEFAPLSAEEQHTLTDLQRELERQRTSHRQALKRQARARREESERAASRCREATGALEALDAERRKGYRATDAAALDARERELSRMKRSNC